MKIQQIRNATLVITYANKKFLTDPWLMPKDYMDGFEMAVNPDVRQPRVELPLPIEEIVDVDAVVLTHYHPDHWDEFAAKALNKDLPFFVQSEEDFKIISGLGFKDVRIIEDVYDFDGIKLYKTGGQHGRREAMKPLMTQAGLPYDAMGLIFKSEGEKTLYLAGDTIFCDEVKSALDQYHPDVIIVNACGATVMSGEKIIMDSEDVKTIAEYAPHATIIASHMDTVSHLTVTRDDIKNLKLNNVVVPADGEILEF